MNRNLLQMLRNIASMGVMRIVSALLSFVLVVYIARVWGKIPLGEFSLALSYFFLLQQMPLLGLHIVLMRDIAADPAAAQRHASNALLLATGVAFLLAIVVAIGGLWVYPNASTDLHHALWLVAASLLPTGLICVIESILIGQQRMHVLAGLNTLENIVRTVVSFIAVYYGAGMTTVFALFLLGRVLTACGYLRWSGIGAFFRRDGVTMTVLRGYLREVPTFVGIMFFAASINRLDFLMLSKLGTIEDVGLYSAPYKIYEVATMVPTVLMMVLFPPFAAAYKHSRAEFSHLFSLCMRFLFLLGTPCIALSVFYASDMMLLFGAHYASAIPALQWLLASLLPAALIQLFSVVLLVTENQHLDCKTLGIACVGYAIFLGWSIPQWGFMGAALSTFGVALLQTAVRYYFTARTLRLNLEFPLLGQTLVAAFCMTLVLFVLRTHSVLAGIAAIATYALALVAMKAVTADQLQQLMALARRKPAMETVAPASTPTPAGS